MKSASISCCGLGHAVIIGYSLGASIALSLGAEEPDLAGIVVWSGSLPDEYREPDVLPPLLILHGSRDTVIPEYNAQQLGSLCKLRRFKCDLEIFPDEGHAFSQSAITRAEAKIRNFLDVVLKQ